MVNSPKPALHGKNALVVGGTSGIGLAAAVGLARAGVSQITLVGRNADRGARAQQVVSAEGASVEFLASDASQPEQASQIVNGCAGTMGSLDIVINAVAPVGTAAPIDQQPAQDLLDLMVALAAPPLLITAAAISVMRESGGSIVNIASDAAKVPTPGEAAVGAGMAAITMFSRTAALEAKRYGVRVNVLTPSLVLDTGTAARISQMSFATKIFDKIAQKASLGIPNAEEVAELVVFLSGPGAGKITGQVISVNGGISAS